jgi:hypothetical protein
MIHSEMLIRDRQPTTRPRRGKLGRDTQKDTILRVLARAAEDDDFIARLTDQGSRALHGYNLSTEAKAALLSGDIAWVEARVGRLSARLRTWFDCRLQQEIW